MAETTIKKPSSKAAEQENGYALSSLKALSRELERLKKEDMELVLPLILKSGAVRVSSYISKTGRRGMAALLNAARWIDGSSASSARIKNFRTYENLMANFQLNRDKLGKVWYGRWQSLKDENEYLRILRKIIFSPLSNRVIWNAFSFFGVNPRLGYIYREGKQKPILVVIDQDGFIERGTVLEVAWKDVLAEMSDFYKIDNFPDIILSSAQ